MKNNWAENWVEDYNEHRSRLKEGIQLLRILDGPCDCEQIDCYLCEPLRTVIANDGVLSALIDEEEDTYHHIMNTMGQYPEKPREELYAALLPEQIDTIDVETIVQAWAYWSPTREEDE